MLELATLVWTTAIFCAFSGALRGWRREFGATAVVVLGFFAIFQFDSLLRGSLFLLLSNELIFALQTAIYVGIVAIAYRNRLSPQTDDTSRSVRGSLLGAAAGFFNGYVVAGSIWYFLDINRYPFPQLISAPSEASASFQSIGLMPIVLLGGGLAGSGALLALVILGILAVVLVIT